MKSHLMHVSDDFSEVTTRSIDERKRLCVGDLLKDFKRVRVYQNAAGEILIQPMVEIPASEVWLFKNKKALASVQKGLRDAASGKVSKLNLNSL
ncbi:MAG: hypothetical protein HY593_04965 [Candidatus Omnitrophica bacterium]|nr:hypothetical protein [Candidatus Omnitrophota bacterium]